MSERVAVLGGGVAGLTAAHELEERGFEVTVYEARDRLGGKARSLPVPGTDLPGEHGQRHQERGGTGPEGEVHARFSG